MKKETSGFTLIELIITIALAAILLGIGVPGFNELISTNRLAGGSNEFIASMGLARSEAIKSRANITVTASDSSDSGNEWGKGGWSVTDSGGNSLKVVAALADAGITLDSVGGKTFFTYSANGAVDSSQNLYMCAEPGDPERWIQVTATGRVSISRGDDAATANNPDSYACP